MLDFLFFHPDEPRFYCLDQIGMNRGQNRECLTEALLRNKLFLGTFISFPAFWLDVFFLFCFFLFPMNQIQN